MQNNDLIQNNMRKVPTSNKLMQNFDYAELLGQRN